MKKKSLLKFLSQSKIRIAIGILVLVLIVPLVVAGSFVLVYWNKTLPHVYVGSVDFGGKDRNQVAEMVGRIVDERKSTTLAFAIKDHPDLVLGAVGDYASYDVARTVDMVYGYGRSGDAWSRIKNYVRSLYGRTDIVPVYSYDKARLDASLADAVRMYEQPVVNAQLGYNKSGVYLTPSAAGYVADRDAALSEFESYLGMRAQEPRFSVPLSARQPEITAQNSEAALAKAQAATLRPLILKSGYLKGSEWTLTPEQIFSLLDIKTTPSHTVDTIVTDYKVASWSGQIATLLNRDPIDARFQLDNDRVSIFQPAQTGLALDSEALTREIATRVFDPSQPAEIEVPVKTTEPALSTANVNNYGIKELVGQGKSKFAGSIPGRLHNIDLASSKLNGVLIAPGEVFSMYKYVGEVEKATGFEDAYIIKDGRTVPGTGGGLCQVSTTMFRAALNAGLPIKERHEHAYRVHYYEEDSPVGIDAAVYFPSWDFKFLNDTGNYLLLQTKVDLKGMTAEFNLYGVKDGRVVTLTKPVVTDQTPPPPELRQDDPTLPRGQVKQVDWSAWGANVSFSRKVTKDGQTVLSDVFKSHYRPWQAVYMVGVKD